MARLIGWIGCSVDGYIARRDHGLDWLERHAEADMGGYGYDQFIKGIGVLVMGRATFDVVMGMDHPWPYGERRCIVVTTRPLPDGLPSGVEAWPAALLPGLVSMLRAGQDGDAWIVGGGTLITKLLAINGLDLLEVQQVPELLGDGIRLFPSGGGERSICIEDARLLPGGLARLLYRIA